MERPSRRVTPRPAACEQRCEPDADARRTLKPEEAAARLLQPAGSPSTSEARGATNADGESVNAIRGRWCGERRSAAPGATLRHLTLSRLPEPVHHLPDRLKEPVLAAEELVGARGLEHHRYGLRSHLQDLSKLSSPRSTRTTPSRAARARAESVNPIAFVTTISSGVPSRS